MSRIACRAARTPAALVMASAALVISGPGAEAAGDDYEHVTRQYVLPGPGEVTGGADRCPSGKQVVALGARIKRFTVGGTAVLTGLSLGSGPSTAFGSVVGTRFARPDSPFKVVLRCVDAGRVKGSSRLTSTVTDQQSRRRYVKRLTCPRGTVPYAGGGRTVDAATGAPDMDGIRLIANFPHGREWIFAAYGELGGRELQVSARCLPRSRLGHVKRITRTREFDVPDLVHFPTVGCPDGYFPFAGGAWTHVKGKTRPKRFGWLQSSLIGVHDRAWKIQAMVIGDPPAAARLSVTVLCTTRLG